jgi:hypothetical protein
MTETISTTGGVPVSGSTSTIYSGRCDAQENSRQFNVANGFVASKGSATVFLPDGKVQSKGVSVGDSITITWTDGSTKAGRVESPSNLDDTFLVQYS